VNTDAKYAKLAESEAPALASERRPVRRAMAVSRSLVKTRTVTVA
jgi:hypothetical protein